MSIRTSFFRPRVAALAGIAAGLAAFALPVAAQAAPTPGKVKVMSRNLYLGADLTGALQAQGSTALAVAAQEIWNDVHTTDFPNRARLLAKEIKDARPDLVGLQEVALWRADLPSASQTGPDGPITPAQVVEFDFLRLLMAELERQGANYKVVRQQKEADIEAPLSGGNPLDGRLTMRDVVLKRKGAGVVTRFQYSKRFDNNLEVNVGGLLDVKVWRGFIAMDANVRGTEFRFVNTHLEAFDNTAKLAQAQELVQGLPAEPGPASQQSAGGPVVLVGDLNSDNEIVEDEGDTPQHQADELPYAALTDAGLEERSFDGTEEDAIDDAVYSCCFDDELIAEAPATALDDIDHTVDHVMVSDNDPGSTEAPDADDITLVNSFNTGADPAEYARFGRWASDHLGVVSTLQFPTGP